MHVKYMTRPSHQVVIVKVTFWGVKKNIHILNYIFIYYSIYLLLDGTGVGKGRQIAGIILENVIRNKLVKHVWISASANLMYDALRDLTDLNFEEHCCGIKIPCFNISKLKPNVLINDEYNKGILFSTYMSLIRRKDQIIQWLGEDFEGCIIFDESHKAKGIDNTATGKIVCEIQLVLRKARVVYCSATGASNIDHLEYMNRLDLWGEKSLFKTFRDLKEASKRGGIGIMEFISAHLKSKGQYNARTLSGEGCTYMLKTTDISKEHEFKYDESCKLWQEIWITIKRGIKSRKYVFPIKEHEETKRDKNEPSIFDDHADKRPLMLREKNIEDVEKATLKIVKTYYWSAHQRFFRSLCQSLKVNDAVKIAKSALGNIININIVIIFLILILMY